MKKIALLSALYFSIILTISATASLSLQTGVNDSLEIKENTQNQLHSSVYSNSTNTNGNSVFDYLSGIGEEVLDITLTSDLQNLIVNRNSNEYQMANIKARDSKGEFFDFNLKVKPRGKYRRKVCDFPPLKLNFSKEALEKNGFVGKYDKLKLVAHCKGEKFISKEAVLREYLTYKLYNELTDNSFRVQLVKIKYIDLHNAMKPFTRYGFLIEDTDEMAVRLNGEICDCHGLNSEMLMRPQSNLMAVFQYMVGNEDWDVKQLRNVKAVNVYTGMENIIVPYDFDFSGMVNANYAIPDPNLKHAAVRDRHFFGDFSDELEYEKMANYFLSKKKNLEKTIKGFKPLSLTSRIDCLEYLNEFFTVLEDEVESKNVFSY